MYRIRQQQQQQRQQQPNSLGVESSEDSDVIVTESSTSEEESRKGRGANSDKKVPKMLGRSHLLEGVPEDIRRYFVNTQIEGSARSNKEIAINLRLYSQINKAHHKEVVAILNEDAYVDVSQASTRYAMLCLAKFKNGEKKRKITYASRVNDCVSTYKNCFADFTKTKESMGFPRGLRAAGVGKILRGQESKLLVIDISNKYFRNQQGLFRFSDPWTGEIYNSDPNEFNSRVEEEKLVAMLNTELKKYAKKKETLPAIHLICKEQAFHTVLYPLVKNLANFCSALQGFRLLELGYETSIQKYFQFSSRDQHKTIMNETWDCAGFLGKIFEGSKSLQTIKLNNMYIFSLGLIQISEGLALNNNLTQLDLSKNSLIEKNVSRWHSNLGTYIYDNLGSGLSSKYWGISKLVETLKKKTSLKVLRLIACDLDDQAADMLLSMLNENKDIEHIDLSRNDIRNDHPIFLNKRVFLDDPERSDSSLNSSSDDS